MSQKIRIKLKSFDHMLVDKSAKKIVDTVASTGARVNGPIPLPTDKKIFTVFCRLLDIYDSTQKTVDALMKLELPSGVEVEIKV